MRTGRVGLAYFLYKVGVLGYNSSLYSYKQADKTLRHLLLYCPESDDSRRALGQQGKRSLLDLLGTLEGA